LKNLVFSPPHRKASSWPARTVDAGVDWLTCTAKRNGCAEELWAVGDTILRENALVGHEATRWQAHGYRGWCSEGVRLGARTEGAIVSLSGFKCSEHWHKALTASEHCSRLDLTVDVHLDTEVPALASDCYETLFHVPPRNGRPQRRTLISNSDGGSTLYFGSRVSDRFARLYDKGIEQQTSAAGKWWRFELEIKGKASAPSAADLLSAESHSRHCFDTVADFFKERSLITIPGWNGTVVRHECRNPTTDARRLHWLASQVRGTVLELTRSVGRRRVLEALGLMQSEDTEQ
jgi:DNA relaxase NicK